MNNKKLNSTKLKIAYHLKSSGIFLCIAMGFMSLVVFAITNSSDDLERSQFVLHLIGFTVLVGFVLWIIGAILELKKSKRVSKNEH